MVVVGRDLCGSPSPTTCQSRVTQSRLHRTASRRVLKICREGDSTTSLGSLCQGSVTLRVKKFFLKFSCPAALAASEDAWVSAVGCEGSLSETRGVCGTPCRV